MKSVTAPLVPLVAVALAALSLASAAELEPEPDLEWNQERVTALAQDLIKHLEVIRAEIEKRPSVPERAAARATVTNDLERLGQRARELAERLARGEGRAETAPLFHEVEALGNQAAEHSREYPADFELHVDIDRVQRISIQLARYYGES